MIRSTPASILASAALIWALAPNAGSAGGEIAWSGHRPLRWMDFRGPPDPKAPARHVAATASSLVWTYAYESESDGKHCTFRITELHASAVFDPKGSWVKPGHRTPAVLRHEQGHFDITEIHRRMFDGLTGSLVGRSRRCTGTTRRQVTQLIERQVTALVGPIYDAVWRSCLETQSEYDRRSGHGTDTSGQTYWNDGIARGLRSNGWRDFVPGELYNAALRPSQ
jgi:hypothetical protein